MVPVPYKGDAPYIFVSYPHRVSDRVYPIMQEMQRDGFRLWFDEGIGPGAEWDENIAARIKGCSYFVAFITKEYLESQNCKDELYYARDNKIACLIIYLENVDPPEGMKMRINRLQAIYWYRYANNEQAAYNKLYETDGLGICRDVHNQVTPPSPPSSPSASESHRGKKAMILFIAALAMVAAIVLYINPWNQDERKNTPAATSDDTIIYTRPVENDDETVTTEPPKITLTPTKTEIPTAGPTASPESAILVGDLLTFGRYEQDNNSSNGTEPIEWQVLAVEDSRALLISRYGLDTKPYNENKSDITWEDCTLRAWMNGEFYDSAFSPEEKERIQEVENKNPNNPDSKIEGGKNTKDRIFLLSIDEANKYFSDNKTRKCEETEYAATNRTYGLSKGNFWWLRSPGGFRYNAAVVSLYGVVRTPGYQVYDTGGVVRPAFWLNVGDVQENMGNTPTETPENLL